tara:strand:+ start:143 stop:1339 length:1197 start_codon:yes stop_codon:yes gene_type:complete
MAVYKLFPTQDATLYSYYPAMNTGLDAICEVSNELNPLVAGETPMIARYLTQFNTNEIKSIINDKIGNSEFNVYLKNFISEAQGINLAARVEIRPVAQSWNNGTGHYKDLPQVEDGVSWGFRNYSGSSIWSMTGSYNGFQWTGSYNPNYAIQGGGNWYKDDSNSQFIAFGYVIPGYMQGGNLNLNSTSQSFALRDPKDIEVPVKPIVDVWNNDSIPNYGFIVKLSGSYEFNTSKYVQPILKYYSVDTNTIYPPQLEFRWRDYSSTISPTSSLIVSNSNIKLSLSENPQEFNQNAINRFHINVSPLYPTRVFQTSSLFTGLHYLPTASYYAVKDLDTNEFVINFDTQYTQISSDSTGNYFDIYMNGLEPERYYSVLIKTEINGSTLIIDDDNYFKVING